MAAIYNISSQVMEEYFAVLAEYSSSAAEIAEKNRELMRSYAEFKFRILGGSRCAVCKAHVRHVLQTIVLRRDGEVRQFTCLCTRCMEGEKALAERVFQQIGNNRVELDLRKRLTNTVRTAASIAASMRAKIAKQKPTVH